jgi:nitrite transporter NirC
VIFWCLFAFIACGFEHSVANMTLFSLTLFAPHPDTITVGGMFYNLLWVSLGNIIAGALFMAAGYGLASGKAAQGARVAPMAVAAE